MMIISLCTESRTFFPNRHTLTNTRNRLKYITRPSRSSGFNAPTVSPKFSPDWVYRHASRSPIARGDCKVHSRCERKHMESEK